MNLLRNGWCWHDLACSCQTNKAHHARPSSLPHGSMCLVVIDPRDALHTSACVKKLNKIYKYVNTWMYYYVITHWSSQSSQTKKKPQCTYWIQLHRVISSVSSFILPRLVDQAIEIVESNHSALALSQDHYRGRAGKGVWPGMGIHGYSSLYHPSHQLKKTRGQWENRAVYPSISHLFEKLYLNDWVIRVQDNVGSWLL